VIDEDNYKATIVALHGALIEPYNHEYAIASAEPVCFGLTIRALA